MANTGYIVKAQYRDVTNIEHFIKCHGVGRGNTFFFTLTFRDNITDKSKASALWHNLYIQIKKQFKHFKFVCVAERQKRGAWHFHLLCNLIGVSLNQLTKFIKSVYTFSHFSYGYFQLRWTQGTDLKKLVHYISKYLTKEKREPKIRYVSYSQNFIRVCRLPFAWVGGRSREWRQKCSLMSHVFGNFFNIFYRDCKFSDKLEILSQESLLKIQEKIEDWLLYYSDSFINQSYKSLQNNPKIKKYYPLKSGLIAYNWEYVK